MGTAIRINDDIYLAAQRVAGAERRSIPQQIEFWALVGKTALENPELPVEFVRELLISKHTDRALAEPFVFASADAAAVAPAAPASFLRAPAVPDAHSVAVSAAVPDAVSTAVPAAVSTAVSAAVSIKGARAAAPAQQARSQKAGARQTVPGGTASKTGAVKPAAVVKTGSLRRYG